MNKKFFVCVLMFCLAGSFLSAKSEAKNALLIANNNYKNATNLSTPVTEAEELAKVLRSIGFEVDLHNNVSQSMMDYVLENFKKKCERTGGIALFHFGGHAIQINGDNYLIPVDSALQDEIRTRRDSIELDYVLNCMKGDSNIVILDACRDNPFMYSSNRGFATSRGLSLVKDNKRPVNSVIVFSASEGQVARDGVFTPILTKHITDKKDFTLILRDVRREVFEKTNGRQETVNSDKLISDLYLAGIPDSISNGKVVSVDDVKKNIKNDYFQLGLDEYNKKNFDNAFEYLIQADKNKQKDSYYYLAVLYEKGYGTARDYQKAFEYYEKAGKQNEVRSQIKLGEYYSNGTGVKSDLRKSFAWYKKAADLDDVNAARKVGECYFKGIGTGVNPKESFNYYLKAAIKGDKESQLMVGQFYYDGYGTKKDSVNSENYLKK